LKCVAKPAGNAKAPPRKLAHALILAHANATPTNEIKY
jgi:hypothetical protein